MSNITLNRTQNKPHYTFKDSFGSIKEEFNTISKQHAKSIDSFKKQKNFGISIARKLFSNPSKLTRNYKTGEKFMSDDDALKLSSKLNLCCQSISVLEDQSGKTKVTPYHTCKIGRLCPICAKTQANKRSLAVTKAIENLDIKRAKLIPILVTFTIKNADDFITPYKRIKKAFHKLNKRAADYNRSMRSSHTEWSDVEGYVASMEVSGTIERGFHPHYHVLALVSEVKDLDYMQNRLKKEWESITGDSHQVDVRPINTDNNGLRDGVKEVMKYNLKLQEIPLNMMLEVQSKTKYHRFVSTGGILKGCVSKKEIEDQEANSFKDGEVLLEHRYLREDQRELVSHKKGHRFVSYSVGFNFYETIPIIWNKRLSWKGCDSTTQQIKEVLRYVRME